MWKNNLINNWINMMINKAIKPIQQFMINNSFVLHEEKDANVM